MFASLLRRATVSPCTSMIRLTGKPTPGIGSGGLRRRRMAMGRP
jgi:hypothetical protein